MTKILQRLIGFMIILSMALSGCYEADLKTDDIKMRKIVDCSGNEVMLPDAENLQRIVITSPPIVTMTYALSKDSKSIVGVNPLAIANSNKDLLEMALPNLNDINTSFIKGFDIDVEQLLNLEPDIVFCYGEKQRKSLETLNIPVVDFYKKEKDASKIVKDWEKLICEVLNVQPEYSIEAAIEAVENLSTSVIDEKTSKRALLIFNNSSDKIIVAGSQTYGDYWLDFAGLENVASEIEGEKVVDLEQIYNWQPEVIYLFMGPSKEAYLSGIEHQDWSRIDAVKNQAVYDIPAGLFHWSAPCMDTPLMMRWMLLENKNDQAFFDEMKIYYEKMYDLELTDEHINSILNPVKHVTEK